HLAEDQPLPAAHDEVELDPACAHVPRQDPIATQPEVPGDTPFSPTTKLRGATRLRPFRGTAPHNSAPRRSGGGRPTGPRRPRPPRRGGRGGTPPAAETPSG